MSPWVKGFEFVPSSLNIVAGDTVRWTRVSSGHSVTSGTPCGTDGQFYSPDNTNCNTGVLSNTGTFMSTRFGQSSTIPTSVRTLRIRHERRRQRCFRLNHHDRPEAAPESAAAAHAMI